MPTETSRCIVGWSLRNTLEVSNCIEVLIGRLPETFLLK